MRFEICPYCEQPGWVMTVRDSPDGFQVSGKCWTCGYTSGSDATGEEDSGEVTGAIDPQPLTDCCGD